MEMGPDEDVTQFKDTAKLIQVLEGEDEPVVVENWYEITRIHLAAACISAVRNKYFSQ